MGLMRFVVTPPQRMTEEVAQQAYLSGMERVAWPVRGRWTGRELLMERAVSDSGNLQVPWPVDGRGMVTLATGSLIEQADAYYLPLELARGTVCQVRNQMADWQSAGLNVPAAVVEKLHEATASLARAAVSQESPEASAAAAEQSIAAALDAGDALTAAYVEQVMTVRHRGGAKLPTVLAGNLGSTVLDDYTAKQFVATFNTAAVPFSWREVEATEGSHDWTATDRQVEWCRGRGLKIVGGPLVRLEPQDLPDWLYLWEDDFDNLITSVSEFILATVIRYRGKVSLWQCAARLNTAEVLSLGEEERLRLAARSIELVRLHDPSTPTVISFDQPWAEYMGRRSTDFPPLHFADALARAGLDLKGIMLEINLGYTPGGTLPRTTLEFNRQLDSWASLGLPLLVAVTVPSATHDDPLAQRRVPMPAGAWTPAAQQAWVARYMPLILSKQYVHGVIWNQLRDSLPHDFPHGGLFDDRRQAKPALRTLATIRQAHLK